MRSVAFSLVLCAVFAQSMADEPNIGGVKSAAAKAAVAKASQVEADARAAYLHAAIAAKRVESDELKAAEKAALERDDLDEATAIAALVKTLAVEIEGKAVVAVDSREQWSKPVNLSQGDYVVSATGRWTPKVGTPYLGPEGKIGANGLYGLFIRINGHALTGSNWGTFIGKGQTVEITEDNTVVDFVMNDPGTHDDNDGVVTVTIARVP